MRRCALWAVFAAMCVFPAAAEEGKWTPRQVLDLDAARLKQMGLELPVSRLWDPARGTGLLAGTVSLGGCSASFVSPTGLILTNHHCLFGVVQEHSRPDRDLIANGFIARTQAEELPGRTARVNVPRRFTDVTARIEAAAARTSSDLERSRAIDTEQKALVAECEKKPGARCRVAAFDGGLEYVLVENFELTDVRLVYAPPRSIGEFGGEADNFRWPRHVGDFAIARAYLNGKPYQPEFYFPISTAGVKPGDFVMVMGYPGRTMRSLTAGEMADQRDYIFKLRDEIYGQWIRILEETTHKDAAGAIAVAATLKSLNNSHTNAQGQLAGLARGRLVEKQMERDASVLEWARRRPAFAPAVEAKNELDRRAAERRRTATHDFLLQAIQSGPLALKHAVTLVRLAQERAKPDAERETDYMDREIPRLRSSFERDQTSFYRPADEGMFVYYVERASKLGANERIAALDRAFQTGRVKEQVAALYSGTRVTNLEDRLKMFGETAAQLEARRDPLLALAFALEPELRAWQAAAREHDGAVARLRPLWRRAVIAQAGKPVAPDANSTLRVSFAHVAGYVPRDGVQYTAQTTLAGLFEKHTGVEPFAAPAMLLEAGKRVDPSRIPLDFLSNADTTGGNSGSPTVNGRGELVGLNFDRVWENVANDFGYNPEIARNINVDVRFLIWLLEDVEHATNVLQELGIRR